MLKIVINVTVRLFSFSLPPERASDMPKLEGVSDPVVGKEEVYYHDSGLKSSYQCSDCMFGAFVRW